MFFLVGIYVKFIWYVMDMLKIVFNENILEFWCLLYVCIGDRDYWFEVIFVVVY